jgi:hypothetical protein
MGEDLRGKQCGLGYVLGTDPLIYQVRQTEAGRIYGWSGRLVHRPDWLAPDVLKMVTMANDLLHTMEADK